MKFAVNRSLEIISTAHQFIGTERQQAAMYSELTEVTF